MRDVGGQREEEDRDQRRAEHDAWVIAVLVGELHMRAEEIEALTEEEAVRAPRVPRLAAIANRRHLERVPRAFADHYNRHRPHRALGLAAPERAHVTPLAWTPSASNVNRRDRLGGLIHEYSAAA